LAQKKIWFGGMGAFLYDDTDTYTDGVTREGARIEGQVRVEEAPTDPFHVVRLADIGSNLNKELFRNFIVQSMIINGYQGGREDEFVDESEVDTGASSNEDYSATGESYSPVAGTDMVLISTAFTELFRPVNAMLILLEEDIDSITLNTDLKGWISGDGGSNYDQVTLAMLRGFTTPKILFGTATITNVGNSIVWKVSTHNTKDLVIHGVGALWN